MHFRPFLTAAFSVSNAALVPANSDNSDPFIASLPPLNSPLPGSLSNPNVGNENLQLPDLPSLDLPAPGNEPIPFNLNLNRIPSETQVDNPTFSPDTAQIASVDGAGDGGESSIVTPPIIPAQTQPHMDDLNGMCIFDTSTGQKRRRGKSSCGNPAMLENQAMLEFPAMLEFQQRVPIEPKFGRTKQQEKNYKRKARDDEWLRILFVKNFGPNWMKRFEYERNDYMLQLVKPRRDACIIQSQQAGTDSRPQAFCCLGPSQEEIVPAKLRLARRQNTKVVTNWFNCDLAFPGRPFCDRPESTGVCCVGFWNQPDPSLHEPEDEWRWGFKGGDCVEAILA